MELNLLIDKAASIAGSRYKLAKQLKVSTSNLYAWEKGKACPPGDIALMAAIAGYDPVQWLVRATLEKYEGTEKGDQLARALGKPSPATGEATALGGADAPETSSQDPDGHSTMYRNVNFSTHRPERLRRFFFDRALSVRLRKHSPKATELANSVPDDAMTRGQMKCKLKHFTERHTWQVDKARLGHVEPLSTAPTIATCRTGSVILGEVL